MTWLKHDQTLLITCYYYFMGTKSTAKLWFYSCFLFRYAAINRTGVNRPVSERLIVVVHMLRMGLPIAYFRSCGLALETP